MRKAAVQATKEAVESLLRTEVTAVLGYGKFEASGRNSCDSRNGSYQRTIQTLLGPIAIDVPRDRNGEYEPMAIPKYKRRTDLIALAVVKLYSSGMTDEEMRLIISSIYEANCSKSTISSITDAVVDDVKSFSVRRLPKRLFAFFLDSTYVPLRRDSVQKEAINMALGIGEDGTPLVIGYSITPQESAEAYRELLTGFRSRGLEEVEAAVTDGLAGIDEAIGDSYSKAKRQRCFVHLLRNACSKVGISDRSEAAEDFMDAAKRKDMVSGEAAFAAKWRAKYPKLAVWSEKAENVLTFCEFPTGLRRLIYTNSRIESFSKQIKRMLKKQIRSVAEEALEKRIVSMFLHYNEGWERGRRGAGWKSLPAMNQNGQNPECPAGPFAQDSAHSQTGRRKRSR